MSLAVFPSHDQWKSPCPTLFIAAVHAVAERARAALPDSHGRIERAVALVLDGQVTMLESGQSARVNSQSAPDRFYIANGDCGCADIDYAPARMCKHRLAYGIMKRATVIADERMAADIAQQPPDPFAPETAPGTGIPRQFIVELHGKQFVQYAGLLHLAHERGLQSITATFMSVTESLALAQATATFTDGRTFTEAADATPKNVNSKVAPHFARCALTRAKARALRDALDIAMCSVEELES